MAFATATAYPCDYSHVLHTIATDNKHRVTVRQIIDAIDTWVQFNLRTEHGLATVPRTLDWQWPAGPADGPFRVIMLHNHAFMRDACLLVRTPVLT